MAIPILNHLDLKSVSELRNALLHLTTEASATNVEGKIIYDTGSNSLKYYNGSVWVDLDGSGDIASVGAGSGLTGGGSSGAVTLNVGQGSGITVAADTVSHADTSSVANLTSSSRTYIDSLTFDTFGHVTAYSTATESVVDTDRYVNTASFATGTGILTLTRAGSDTATVTVDLDGRYQIAGSYDNYVSWSISDGSTTQPITSGNTLNIVSGEGIDATVSATDTLTIAAEVGTAANLGVVIVAAGEGIDVSYASGTATVSGEDATTTNKGIASFNTNDFSVSGGAVSIKAGGVANNQLVNDSITIGDSTIALGGTDTTLTGLTDLDLTAASHTIFDNVGANILTIGAAATTVTIPGDLVVTGTTTTNNVEVVSTTNGVIFEGNVADANEGTLLAGTLTGDRTYTLPDATGTVALTSDLPTVNNGTLTVQGTGALGGTGTFTANQSGNTTISISHDDTSTQASVDNSGLTVIQDVGVDGYGHVTSLGSVNLTSGIDGRITAREYAGTITDTATVTHSLASRDVIVQLYDTVTYETVWADVDRDSTNTVIITFAATPTNSIRVLVQKIG